MKKLSPQTVIAALLIAGWLLPTVWPGYAVPFGRDNAICVENYWSHVYLGEAGFFSRGIVLEDTWEGSHGHHWPEGPWILGYLLPVFFCASILICHRCRTELRWLRKAWHLLRVLLVIWAVYTFWGFPLFPTRPLLLAVGYLLFCCAFRLTRSRIQHMGALRSGRLATAIAVVFYPFWLIVLSAVFLVPPFVGLLCYVAASVIFLKEITQEHAEQSPPGDSLKAASEE